MIEGTKQYRGRSGTPKETPASTETPTTVSVEAAPQLQTVTPEDAPASPSRREWFRSIVPTLGNGLVEILRASNNLKRDLHEASHDKK
jgi:hypothetical protein